MYLAITDDGVALNEPEVTTDLYASYWQRLDQRQIAAVLAEHDAGELLPDGAHVMVPVAALRRLAAGQVDEGWDAKLDGLLETVRGRGRLSDDGAVIQAPLERLR